MKNIEMLMLAARGLGALKDEVVFVGGVTIELYLAQRPALKIRPTDDVDCVIEVVSRQERVARARTIFQSLAHA